jgi:trehalose utilization protein
MSDTAPIRVLVWNEYFHEREDAHVASLYPRGLHETIADGLRELLGSDAEVRTATLDEPDHGLALDVLEATDVLLWWGHRRHRDVRDDIVERVQRRVLDGMGLLVLHSGHMSKIFRTLMGTTCRLNWREIDDAEYVWTVNPSHPITEGVPHPIVIPKQEMYGEFFDIPAPDELVFVSSYSKSVEVFRSGCVFRRGRGRIFYFSPGHETYPVYEQPEIRRVLANAVRWAHQREVSAISNTTQGEAPKPMEQRRESPEPAPAG